MKTPKTLLNAYLKVKNIAHKDLAEVTGIGVHSITKTINAAPYRTKSGFHRRRSPKVRRAIALALGLPYAHLWGPRAGDHLGRLIREEIQKQTAARAASLEAKYLTADQASQAA